MFLSSQIFTDISCKCMIKKIIDMKLSPHASIFPFEEQIFSGMGALIGTPPPLQAAMYGKTAGRSM